MQEGNPTAGDSGASTLDRLENYLAAQDDTPEPEETQAPPNDQAQSEPENAEPVDTEDDVSQEADGPQITTDDLAKYLGIDSNLLDLDGEGGVRIKTKIDGQDGAAKLSDFLKSYQLQGHIDNKSREIAEQQRAIQARAAEIEQFAQQRLQQVEDLASIAMNDLTREFNAVDWQQLRAIDPAEYVARQHDFQARHNQLQNALQVTQQQRAQQQGAMQQQTQQQMAQRKTEASSYLAKEIPGWSSGNDVDLGIARYASSLGLGQGISAVIADSPVAGVILHKAMLYDQLQKSKPAVENRVRTTPKIVKPGQPQANPQEASMRNIKSTIRNSGGKQGIVEYLLATGKA
jgi:hypothetical protein